MLPFDPDPIGFALDDVPPGPWDCPSCARSVDAIAKTASGWVCDRCFRAARAVGRNPEVLDGIAL
jgi:ribosomal protein L37AE/L43A